MFSLGILVATRTVVFLDVEEVPLRKLLRRCLVTELLWQTAWYVSPTALYWPFKKPLPYTVATTIAGRVGRRERTGWMIKKAIGVTP